VRASACVQAARNIGDMNKRSMRGAAAMAPLAHASGLPLGVNEDISLHPAGHRACVRWANGVLYHCERTVACCRVFVSLVLAEDHAHIVMTVIYGLCLCLCVFCLCRMFAPSYLPSMPISYPSP
jgi:hypothetical protein